MMDKNKLIDKLVFYESFIHHFCKYGNNTLRDNDIRHLLLAREFIIEARKYLEGEYY